MGQPVTFVAIDPDNNGERAAQASRVSFNPPVIVRQTGPTGTPMVPPSGDSNVPPSMRATRVRR